MSVKRRHPAFDAHIETGLHRLRWHVHRQIDFDSERHIHRRTGRGLGYECTLPHTRIDKAAVPGVAVSARNRCQINPKRLRQSAMRRQLLATPQSPACDVSFDGVGNLPIDRTGIALKL